MRLHFLGTSALFLLAGCGGGTTTSDAGFDSGTASMRDAGTDAPTPVDAAVDTGVDGWTPPDAGSDGGSVLPPIDAGNPFGDAGPLGDPPWVPIDVLTTPDTCPAFAPCGGAVVGTWDITGGCVDFDTSMLSMCPGAMVTGTSGMARGRAVIDATMIHRVGQVLVQVDVFVPALCASVLGGCSGVATRLMLIAPDSACVAAPTGGCNCAVRDGRTIDQSDTYTLVGNEIVTGAGRHYAYCVAGTSLTYEDTTPTGTRELGTITLGMR